MTNAPPPPPPNKAGIGGGREEIKIELDLVSCYLD